MKQCTRLVFAAVVLAVAGFTSSCGVGAESPTPTASPVDQTQSVNPEQKGGATPLTTTIQVVRSDELGNIVADQDGRTLYRFEKDEVAPSLSNCSGQCADAWPPSIVGDDPVELVGIDRSLVQTIERSDGRRQLTLGGRPLYRYEKDKASGETLGHGVGGTWFAATATGQKAAKTLNGATLAASRSDDLGAIVVDADGFTMYRFDKDTANPSKSNCVGDCLKTWPPAIVTTENLAVDGIRQELVSTITRGDGTKQLTIAGWPIYGYSGDKAAGDTTGHGLSNGAWAAVTPDGKKAGS